MPDTYDMGIPTNPDDRAWWREQMKVRRAASPDDLPESIQEALSIDLLHDHLVQKGVPLNGDYAPSLTASPEIGTVVFPFPIADWGKVTGGTVPGIAEVGVPFGTKSSSEEGGARRDLEDYSKAFLVITERAVAGLPPEQVSDSLLEKLNVLREATKDFISEQ